MSTHLPPAPTPTPVASRASRAARRWLPAAAAVAVAAWGANQFTALATVYRARTDWSALSLAAMFSVYLVGLVPGLLLGRPAADRYGRRRVVRGALVLSAVASAVLAVADEPAVYAARPVTGFAAGLVFLAGTTWLRELSGPSVPPETSARRAMYATGAGFAAGALATGVLAEWLPGPTVLPALAHTLGCLLVLRATRRLPETATLPATARNGGWVDGVAGAHAGAATVAEHRAAVQHPRFRYVVLPASPAVLGAATVAYVVLPPLVADRVPGYAPLFGGLVAALTLTMGVLAQPFAARLDDHGSARATLTAMATVIAGLLIGALAAQRDSVGLVLVAAVVLGTGYGLTLGAGLHEVERLATRSRGPTSASLYQSTISSGFLTPLLLAGTAGHASYPALLVGMAVVGVLCLAVTGAHSRRHLPASAGPARSGSGTGTGTGEDSGEDPNDDPSEGSSVQSVQSGPGPRPTPPPRSRRRWAE
ncbi:putative MFS family arabinose efflux permease [Streptomyces sp. 1114.5]|uniref:MFS transporter n=1 Tax=Streptomyces sp. 1114.5 TaxID=1938830 RepID=UPI000EAF2C59|nr:MFS transporter [Streptomyces sp. 1114.5]RKT11444.1 putative MFS family arabinose efflux permease [Streptomyces sp. 1114.5]